MKKLILHHYTATNTEETLVFPTQRRTHLLYLCY